MRRLIKRGGGRRTCWLTPARVGSTLQDQQELSWCASRSSTGGTRIMRYGQQAMASPRLDGAGSNLDQTAGVQSFHQREVGAVVYEVRRGTRDDTSEK
eukprot:6256766-Pyramimonas_sp.AAC.1